MIVQIITLLIVLYLIVKLVSKRKQRKRNRNRNVNDVWKLDPSIPIDICPAYDPSKHKGESFEKSIENKLRSINSEFLCMRNVILKFDNKSSETDLLVLHPNGIVSIECKNYQAFIVGREHYSNWFVYYSKFKKFDILSPIMQNNLHIRVLNRFLRVPDIHNLVVFSNSGRLCKELKECKDVINESQLEEWFKTFLSGNRIYSTDQIRYFCDIIESNRSFDLSSHIDYVSNARRNFGA